MSSGPVEIIAHRGYSAAAPENTAAAMEAAIAAGADALEWDLQFTADGVAVVFHDDDLRRTAGGEGRVADLSLGALSSKEAGGWFGASFRGEPIPVHAALLERLHGRIPRIYPEIKGSPGPREIECLVEETRAAGWAERTVFIAMDWAVLDRIRTLSPEAGIGYVVDRADRWEEALARAADDPRAVLDPDHRILLEDPERAFRARETGRPLAVWTVDDPGTAARLLELGVTRFTTNRVSALRMWRDGLRRAHEGGDPAMGAEGFEPPTSTV